MHYRPSIIMLSIAGVLTFASFALAVNPDMERDTDGDGLTDYEEKAIYQTFWDHPDTDKDGYADGLEIANGYSPWHGNGTTLLQADTDGDGLNDWFEIQLGSNLLIADTDGDGYLDGEEVRHGYSPTDPTPTRVVKRIEVDIDNFRLTYYHGNVTLDSFAISSGRAGWETPRGEFAVKSKVPIKHYYGYPNTPYNLEFAFAHGWKDYIHQAYWHHDFGIANVSTGCVNVPVGKMQPLYEWADVGTVVHVF